MIAAKYRLAERTTVDFSKPAERTETATQGHPQAPDAGHQTDMQPHQPDLVATPGEPGHFHVEPSGGPAAPAAPAAAPAPTASSAPRPEHGGDHGQGGSRAGGGGVKSAGGADKGNPAMDRAGTYASR